MTRGWFWWMIRRPTRPGYRFVFAAQEADDYFISVDDDIFPAPRQWTEFFQCLLANEAVPHGLTGNLYKPGDSFFQMSS